MSEPASVQNILVLKALRYARSHNCPMKFVTKCYVVSSLEVGSSDFCRFALHSYYLKNEDDMKLAASLHRFYAGSKYVCCVAGKKGSSAKGGRKGNTDNLFVT